MKSAKSDLMLPMLAIGVLLLQIILGTQLREGIDILPPGMSVEYKLQELFFTLFSHKGAAVGFLVRWLCLDGSPIRNRTQKR